MKRLYLTTGIFFTTLMLFAQPTAQLNKAFGWSNCSSMVSGDNYTITGGGTRTATNSITLTSTGSDQRNAITSAINNYDIIIFDGSKGDFIVSKSIDMEQKKNKTLVGINNARLCSQFYITDEIRKALDDANVKKLSTSSGTGGTLSNGTSVSEAAEFKTRQTLIDLTGDKTETYRRSGIFNVTRCENIVMRNLKFIGPGSCDVGGYDLISSTYSTHLWIDHCEFYDGIDGNFDITKQSDFVTVTWCTFNYTSRSYDHMNSNLVGSSDSETADLDKLNVTYAYNIWSTGCNQRMPMARFGTIHMLNNYFNCAGASLCINPRKSSEFLIEGNYFEKGVKNPFKANSAKAYQFGENYYGTSYSQSSSGTVTVPYQYTIIPASEVKALLTGTQGAGATLTDPLGETTAITALSTPSVTPDNRWYTLDGRQIQEPTATGLYIHNGKKVWKQ